MHSTTRKFPKKEISNYSSSFTFGYISEAQFAAARLCGNFLYVFPSGIRRRNGLG